jgi:hypothetical protein
MSEQYGLRNFLGASPADIESALERCEVVYFAESPLELPSEGDLEFLRSRLPSDSTTKNVSYHPESDSVPKFLADSATTERVTRILRTHGQRVEAYLRHVLPHLAPGWTPGTTSFRSMEERGRKLKPRSSNELVHFDAGAYGATNGDRILRFFVNVHPTRERVWGTKGTFPALVSNDLRMLSAARHGRPKMRLKKGPLDRLYSGVIGAASKVYPLARVLDSSPYDRSMRRIHNFMKETPAFRDDPSGYCEIHFPPMSAWMVFTDSISHSVLTGQHALVTTLLVPLGNCRLRDFTPYYVLASAG